MSKPKTHWIDVPLAPEVAREMHVEALSTTVPQSIQRVLQALKLRDPQMHAGYLRVLDVPTCPVCGAGNMPWIFGTSSIRCEGGCTFDSRGLFEIFAPTPEELDAALAKISVGRAQRVRAYIFEMLLNQHVNEEPKYRRVVGVDMLATLARLEPVSDSVVRAVVIDAVDLMTAQATLRGTAEIPWLDRLPLDHKGELMDVAWHRAELSQPERELQRRRMAG